MAVYFFYGEEDFNIEQEIEKLKKGLDKNFLEMSFKTDNLDIVFVAQLKRDEGKKLDSRKKFFKTLSKYNAQEFAVIPTYKTAELEGWIIKQAKAKKLKMDTGAATAMISQIGNNLRQLDTELDKLQLMAYPQNVVTPDMVKEICISNEDLFAFSDYLLEGKKDLALREYRKLLEKKYCMEIVSTLQTMLRRWIILKAKSSECTPMELSRLTGQHEYVVKLTLQKLKKTNLKDLVKLKQNITEAEFKIKSGQAPNAEAEVENAFFG